MQVAFHIDLEVVPQVAYRYTQRWCRLMASPGTEDEDIWLGKVGADCGEDGRDFVRIVDGGREGMNFGGWVFLGDALLGFLQ